MAGNEDPGWDVGLGVLWVLVPHIGLDRQRRSAASGRQSVLAMLRQVYLGYCLIVLLLSALVVWLATGLAPQTRPTFAIGLVMLAAATLPLALVLEQRLDCSAEVTLTKSYRTRFFRHMAFGTSAVVAGLIAVVQASEPLAFPPCLLFTVILYWRAIPTAGHIARDSDELAARGCTCSLLHALVQRPTTVNP